MDWLVVLVILGFRIWGHPSVMYSIFGALYFNPAPSRIQAESPLRLHLVEYVCKRASFCTNSIEYPMLCGTADSIAYTVECPIITRFEYRIVGVSSGRNTRLRPGLRWFSRDAIHAKSMILCHFRYFASYLYQGSASRRIASKSAKFQRIIVHFLNVSVCPQTRTEGESFETWGARRNVKTWLKTN